MAATITLDADTRIIIARMTIDGCVAKLPPEQLDRPTYEKVNRALTALGGKWNRSKGGHVFPESPQLLLDRAAGEGTAVDKKKLFNAFYTPTPIANRAAQLANIRTGNRILEPSAGEGALIRAANSAGEKTRIVAVEMDDPVARNLWRQFPRLENVYAGDFLDQTEDELGDFDRIIMNPPFENGADIKHIRHAMNFLKGGGRIVAICADGPRQNDALRPLTTTWESLPDGAFKESGTLVSTAIIVIDAP